MSKNRKPPTQGHNLPGDRKATGRSKPGVLFPAPDALSNLPADYGVFLADIKAIVARERIKAVMTANAAMVLMYWDIGQAILLRQREEGWGARVIDRLAHDLKAAYPEMTGFSPRNLKYMRQFSEAWPDRAIVQRTVAQLPWRSNLTLLDKLSDPETRLWYAQKALELGMGKDMLVIQIDSRLHERQGLLLVKDRNRMLVEYALAGTTKPIGVAQWERQITQSLPDDLKPSLPSVEEIEAELAGDEP